MTAALSSLSALYAAPPVARARAVAFPDGSAPTDRVAQAIAQTDSVAWSWNAGAANVPVGAYGLEPAALRLASARAAAVRETEPSGADTATETGNPMAAAPISAGTPAADAEAADDDEAVDGTGGEERTDDADGADAADDPELTEEEQRQVEDLKQTDREVRQHEQAHLAAAGGYARGGASYQYQQGPDGQRYAVGGEVSIDTSTEDTPEATIRKMQTVQRAATAPAEPSGQDRAVAAQAAAAEANARAELAQQRQAEANGETGDEPRGAADAPAEAAPNRTDAGGARAA